MQYMLNEMQKKAVEDTEGAVLVFAGAGSGKTRVLTHRIIHLIEEKHVPDYNILAITFTNKATNEMKVRLSDMLGENAVWVSTFHSLCVKILFRYAERLGYTSSFSIFDETASKRVMQRVLREKHLEDEKDKDKYRYHISTAKNAGLSPDAYFNAIRVKVKDAMIISEVYERYDEVLKENNAMDFDDLLMKCRELLTENEDVLDYYQRKFRYIHVDEFQDTNEIQFEIVRLLAGHWGNVFVVGDDDQSIYGWRGANVKNILEFDRAFPEVKTYKLEQNYRSTQQILDAANRLIKHNKSRSDKQLFSDKKDGVKVEYLFCANEYNEVDNVTDRIVALKRQGYTNGDFAILVRTNSLTRLFEKSFNSLRLPYRVFGGFKFFDRKEILDVVAYMRLIVNPSDSEALTRIINFPKRGIGDTTVAHIEEYAASIGEPLNRVIDEIYDVPGVSPAAKAKIAAFNEMIAGLTLAKGHMKLEDFAAHLVKTVGFEDFYKSQEKEEEIARWENIDEFLRYIEETTEENPDLDLTGFLQTLALNNEVETEDDGEKITIATMHSAKGLEFRVVFIVACEEGILPSSLSLKEKDGVEEERRVMYVAMTRAQERLYISCVKGVRNRFNRQENTMPSRFISEAKGEQPKSESPSPFSNRGFGGYGGQYGYNKKADYRFERTDDYSDAIPHEGQMRLGASAPKKTAVEQPKKVYNKSTDGFVSGAKVKHKKYGIGTVIIVTGSGPSTTVTVAFKDLGLKKFALMNAPLELI